WHRKNEIQAPDLRCLLRWGVNPLDSRLQHRPGLSNWHRDCRNRRGQLHGSANGRPVAELHPGPSGTIARVDRAGRPLTTVMMAAHDSHATVRESVESVLSQ